MGEVSSSAMLARELGLRKAKVEGERDLCLAAMWQVCTVGGRRAWRGVGAGCGLAGAELCYPHDAGWRGNGGALCAGFYPR